MLFMPTRTSTSLDSSGETASLVLTPPDGNMNRPRSCMIWAFSASDSDVQTRAPPSSCAARVACVGCAARTWAPPRPAPPPAAFARVSGVGRAARTCAPPRPALPPACAWATQSRHFLELLRWVLEKSSGGFPSPHTAHVTTCWAGCLFAVLVWGCLCCLVCWVLAGCTLAPVLTPDEARAGLPAPCLAASCLSSRFVWRCWRIALAFSKTLLHAGHGALAPPTRPSLKSAKVDARNRSMWSGSRGSRPWSR